MKRTLICLLAISVVFSMVLAAFPAMASDVTEFESTGTDEITVEFPDGGGTSEEATIKLPAIAVARTAGLKVSSEPVEEEKFTDFRKDESTDMNYKNGYYHDFPPVASTWDGKEMTVSKNGATLRKYTGVYNPDFGSWDFVDNASTTANYLLDDGMDSRIVAGGDNGGTAYIPGPGSTQWDCQKCRGSGQYTGTVTKTYFADGKLFKSATARADYQVYPYSYYQPYVTVKGWNVNLKNWQTLVNNVGLPYSGGTYNDYVFFSQSWSTPKFSQIQVKITTSYSWSSYYWVGFEFQGQTQGFMDSSTFTSRGADASEAGSMDKNWGGWDPSWKIYNATLIPDETIPSGCGITYYMSANNGTNWEQVQGNTSHTFQNTGRILRWKAVLTTNSDQKTPAINEIDIRFNRLYSNSQVFTAGKYNTKWPITAVKPIYNGSEPSGTSIVTSVSNDNGTTWKDVANGNWMQFPWTTAEGLAKTELLWKAELKSSDGKNTPMLKNITVHYVQAMYPSDIVIKTGTLNEPLWTYDGFLFDADGVKDIDGNELVIDLNYILPHLDQGDMVVPINISSESAGKVKLSSLNVVYGEPPVLAKDIPPQVIDEDTGVHSKIVDLETFFTDDFDDGKLSFEIPFQEDPGKVKAWIEEKHYLSIETVKPNWYGQVRFVVRAIDAVGLKTQSNTFTVEVKNVNDKPSLVQPPDFTVLINELFEYQLQVDDYDLDTFTFSMSPPVLYVEPSTGKIAHTPTIEQIGVYDVSYTVRDAGGLSDTKTGKIEVVTVNTPPTLKQIGPQFPTVGQEFKLQVTAEDADLIYSDELTFSLEFDQLAPPEGMTIDPASGMITWKADKPGSYWTNVIVTDKAGAHDSEFVTFTVERVNTKPFDIAILSPVVGTEYNTSSQINFIGTAKDDDPGDKLFYTWYIDGTQFGVNSNFRTVVSKAGTYTVKLVVTDGRDGHDISTETTLVVKEAPKKSVEEIPGEKVEEGGMADSLLYLLVLLVVVIVVIVLSTIYGRGGATKQKLKALENEMHGKGQMPPK